MSIQPTTSAVETTTLVDFDFDHNKDNVKVTCKVGDTAIISIAAHWETLMEWCCEKYDFSGYNVALRTVEVMEAVGQDYGMEDFDYSPAHYDAKEKLSELGFGDKEQVAFFQFMLNEALPQN